MPEKVTFVCDVGRCNADEDVQRYTIAVGQDAVEVLACPKHAAPLEVLRAAGRPTAVGLPPRRPAGAAARGLTKGRLDSLVRP